MAGDPSETHASIDPANAPSGEGSGEGPGEGHDDTMPARAAGSEPAAPSPPSERYRLGVELGRGGMGRVVEAFDTQLGRSVALKEVLPRAGNGSARRFAREVQLTARLEHPSIVPLYDSGTTPDGRPYYVMRRVSGRPFDELITRARSLEERLTLLPALLSAIDAVAHAHRRGVIHRDLKPGNILVGELGETVVIDWGLAKVIGEEDEPAGGDSMMPSDSLQTQIGTVFGTPGFMAPEQARGEELGTGGDVYALGATLYQLLAGKPPHAGDSATDMLAKTLRHQIIPLEQIAPGAPAELVTIVTKALALEAVDRYPDAAALGEDVRRFLAGQIVAAHRYTPQQKLVRFARRHRAVLGVIALATVAVAVMAWIGVHRIVTERDAATAARASAIQGQQAAEAARRQLAERHDALLVTQARALLDINPTAAAATLKQLSPTSSRLAEARAVAQAAATRGVAWAMPSTQELTFQAEQAPDGRLMLQVSRDGMVQVWDLERRRNVVSRTFARDTRAAWISGGRLLIMPRATAAAILDVTTGALEALSIGPIDYAIASGSGTHVLFTTSASGVSLLDVATRAVQTFGTGKASSLTIAPDGSWFAFVDGGEVIAIDVTGRELARRRLDALRVLASAHRTLAVIVGPELFELALAPTPTWTTVPVALTKGDLIINLVHRGREVLVVTTKGTVIGWNGTRVIERAAFERMGYDIAVGGDGVAIVRAHDGRLRFFADHLRGALTLPSSLLHARIVTSPGSRHVVAIGRGLVVGFELDAIMPRVLRVEHGTEMAFVDDDLALSWSGRGDWAWIDLATGTRSPIALEAVTFPQLWDIDPSGRVLVRDGIPRQARFVLLARGSSTVEEITRGKDTWARLLPGGHVLHSGGDGRLFVRSPGQPVRELVKLDGAVDGGAPVGSDRFTAHSRTGELVRGSLEGGALERARVDVGNSGYVIADRRGRVVIAEDNRLSLWDTTVVDLATFDRTITRLATVAGDAVAVELADREIQLIELRPGATPHRLTPPSGLPTSVSRDGRLVAGIGNASQINVIELPSRSRWSLPDLYASNDPVAVSPSRRQILHRTGGAFVLWQLPEAPEDLAAWLDELTNATVDRDGQLTWPWQTP